MKDKQKIIIFYHIYANEHYQKIINYHLEVIKKSSLYDQCDSINVSVIYKDKKDLDYVIDWINSNDKINLYHSRKFKSLPTILFKNSIFKCNTELGEGETIMKMYDYSIKNKSDNDLYMFIHTKGTSLPPDSIRSQTKKFVPNYQTLTPTQLRDTIQDTLTKKVIIKWKDHVDQLNKDKVLYYYVWNFFWVKGSLLRKFDEKKYIAYSQRGKQYKAPINRHYTAYFPLGLYEMVNKKQLNDHQTNIGRYL